MVILRAGNDAADTCKGPGQTRAVLLGMCSENSSSVKTTFGLR